MQHFAESKEGCIGEIKQKAANQARINWLLYCVLYYTQQNSVPRISASSQRMVRFSFLLTNTSDLFKIYFPLLTDVPSALDIKKVKIILNFPSYLN